MSDQPTSPVTAADIDALVSGATPQFSMQLLERLKALVSPLPESDPVREYGELQMRVLERIAMGTTRGIRAPGVPDADDPAWASLPSHPRGGIAPGAGTGHAH